MFLATGLPLILYCFIDVIWKIDKVKSMKSIRRNSVIAMIKRALVQIYRRAARYPPSDLAFSD